MAKTSIIIDGAGVTATFNSVAISDINSITFCPLGERDEINLTTIDNSNYEVGLLGDLVSVQDIVINKKFDPAADMAHSLDSKQLVITYKVGKSTTKTITFWAQLKSVSVGTIERSPGEGVNVDLTFAVTNLNASLVETGPAIA
ncbi:MAG: hypothetical protein SNJ71_00840 [Bacteroidales bacterium]